MQLKDLNAFMHIAELGSLHAAAEAVGMSQPALSKLVRRLETSLDVRLLERTTRGVALTEFGRVLHRRSKELQQSANDTRSEIADMKAGRSGRLRLGAVPTVVDAVVAPVLGELVESKDPIAFFTEVQLSSRLLHDLQAGQLDFAIASIPAQVPDGLSFVPLWQQQTHVVARKGHWMLRRRFTLQDLARQQWMLPPGNIILRTWVETMFTSADLAPPKVWVETDASPAAFATLVRKSDIVTAMTIDSLHSPMGTGLAPLGPPAASWSTHMGLFWRRTAYFSKPMERCRERILASARLRGAAAAP
jgi:DNA-binding transcriptional LysR family regulator